MKFDDIIGNRMLWAVKYDGDEVNVLNSLFEKLTHTMQERSHTLKELETMEMVRNYLIDNGVTDLDGFIDFQNYS